MYNNQRVATLLPVIDRYLCKRRVPRRVSC